MHCKFCEEEMNKVDTRIDTYPDRHEERFYIYECLMCESMVILNENNEECWYEGGK